MVKPEKRLSITLRRVGVLQYFYKMNIRTKTFTAFLMLLILLVLNFLLNIYSIIQIDQIHNESQIITEIHSNEKVLNETIISIGNSGSNERIAELKEIQKNIFLKWKELYSISDEEDFDRLEKIANSILVNYDKGAHWINANIKQNWSLLSKLYKSYNSQEKETRKLIESLKTEKANYYYTLSNYIKITNIILVILAFIVIIAGYFIVKYLVVKPLLEINEVIGKTSKGNYTLQFDSKLDDEIGTLGRSVNSMMNNVSSVIHDVQESFKDVIVSTEKLVSSMEKTSVTIHNILDLTKEVDKNTDQQSTAVQQAKVSVSNMNQYIAEVRQSIDIQNNSVEQTNISIKNMEQSIAEANIIGKEADNLSTGLTQVAQDGGKSIHKMIEAIEEIEHSSQEIAEIVVVINGIAEQTNLLAMNAAIEAAHAGDYGKGFAVVADEIRKLAENSGVNSRNISELIKRIVDKISNTVSQAKAAETGLNSMLEDIRKASEINTKIYDTIQKQGAFNRDIVSTIDRLIENTKKVQSNTGNLESEASEINKVVEHVLKTGEDIKSSSKKQLDEADQIKASLSEVDLMIKNNNNVLNHLKKQLEHFQVKKDNKNITTIS